MTLVHDLNTRKVMKNAFRITKNKYMTAVRIRIPGGSIRTDTLKLVEDLADKYGSRDRTEVSHIAGGFSTSWTTSGEENSMEVHSTAQVTKKDGFKQVMRHE